MPSPALDQLLAIMAALRTPGTGCPWDLAQTSRSIAPYAIEEAYEAVDAIERGDLDDIRDELGDLLLQVVFHARIAEEAGQFTFDDVAQAICGKMIRRHPHVFGDLRTASPETVQANWESIKARERQDKRDRSGSGDAKAGLLADVPVTLPGLTRAVKLQSKASRVGFDWGDARLVLAKIREEIGEIEEALDGPSAEAVAGEIGDLLFAVANLARHAKTDPETAVRATNSKFERRFAYIEQELAARGSSPEAATLDEMDALWDEAKTRGL
ncbi:MAG: nucleoside triphosphate pyrophosphohydrolase [Beijerinckiaceae bacterium]|nr:nucleoside triphosphate pyrophosphohydrolase [Beijerinckiaceae bacterium]